VGLPWLALALGDFNGASPYCVAVIQGLKLILHITRYGAGTSIDAKYRSGRDNQVGHGVFVDGRTEREVRPDWTRKTQEALED
jgi:hypothetical protein